MLIFRVFIIFFLVALNPLNIAGAQNNIELCNTGNAKMSFLVFSTKEALFGTNAAIEGWYSLNPGRCANGNPHNYDTAAIAFIQTDKFGTTGNPLYVLPEARLASGEKWAPAILCANLDRIKKYGSFNGIFYQHAEPCAAGTYPLKTSMGWRFKGGKSRLNIKSDHNKKQRPWPYIQQSSSVPPTSSRRPSAADSEVIGGAMKVVIELENRNAIHGMCTSSTDGWAYASESTKSLSEICNCSSRGIVRGFSAAKVSAAVSAAEKGAPENWEDIWLTKPSEWQIFQKALGFDAVERIVRRCS